MSEKSKNAVRTPFILGLALAAAMGLTGCVGVGVGAKVDVTLPFNDPRVTEPVPEEGNRASAEELGNAAVVHYASDENGALLLDTDGCALIDGYIMAPLIERYSGKDENGKAITVEKSIPVFVVFEKDIREDEISKITQTPVAGVYTSKKNALAKKEELRKKEIEAKEAGGSALEENDLPAEEAPIGLRFSKDFETDEEIRKYFKNKEDIQKFLKQIDPETLRDFEAWTAFTTPSFPKGTFSTKTEQKKATP